MPKSELEQSILGVVSAPGFKPSKPRVIAKLLGLSSDEDVSELKRAIKKLVKRGQVAWGANHLVAPVAASAVAPLFGTHVTGTFRRTDRGFGFVRPQGSSPSVDRRTDIYIAANDAKDASSGDVVIVRLRKKRDPRRPNPEGEIAEVLERQTNQFVGVYFESAGSSFVQIDGKVFSQPISVGDPGAKNAQPDDKVVIEMIRFPSHAHDGEGVITEVLGPRGSVGVDTLSIIREFDLPEEFAEDALDEAREAATAFDESIPPERRDLTDLTVVTIDPRDARDFDDAISLEKTQEGHWRLGVHIADVSHFVQPKTALDREAHDRATSVYLPDRVIPMIPELISNGLASLQPHKVRYTKSVFIEFTEEGVPVHAEPMAAAIKSAHRFNYEEVDEYLANPKPWQKKLTPEVFALLGRMYTLAMTLRRRRIQRGALELTMPEVKIDLDKEGRVAGAHLVQNTESHQIIEEFMLAANEAVAEHLAKAGLFFLRRVHHAPDPRKMKALTEFVTGMDIQVDSLEDRFELQKVLAAVSGTPQERAVNFAVLRSMQRAVYSPEEAGHYALASETYCHFTSPIRRYPDLTIHRLLEALLARKKPTNDFEQLVILGDHCSNRERRAESAEFELVKVKLLNYLSTRIGEVLDAVVTGVEEFGLFVQGIDLPAEGLVHVSSLADDFYRYDRAAHTLSGNRSGNTFRLGDRVKVSVARVDVDRRELDFRLVGRGKREPLAVQHKPTMTEREVLGRGSRGAKRPAKGNGKAERGKTKKRSKRGP